jgi:hypothetical protein
VKTSVETTGLENEITSIDDNGMGLRANRGALLTWYWRIAE